MEAGAGAEVPFADGDAAVAGGAEECGEDFFAGGEAEVDFGFTLEGAGVELVAEAALVAAGEEGGAGGAADGAGGIAVGEADAVAGEGGKVGVGTLSK